MNINIRIVIYLSIIGLALLWGSLRMFSPTTESVSRVPENETRSAPPIDIGAASDHASGRAVHRQVIWQLTGEDLIPEGSDIDPRFVDEYIAGYIELVMQEPEEEWRSYFEFLTWAEELQRQKNNHDPYEFANREFESNGWSDIVYSLDLSQAEQNQVRDIVLEHLARNSELTNQFLFDEIDAAEIAAILRPEDLLFEYLANILSDDQIERIRAARNEYFQELSQATQEQKEISMGRGHHGIVSAAYANDLSAVRTHIDSGADVNRKTSGQLQRTPLYDAVRHGNTEMARMLIDAGADVNLTVENERSPLQTAAGMGDVAMIRLLIAAGADLEHTKSSTLGGGTALWRAATNGHTEAVEELLVQGADASGLAGVRALESAIELGDMEMEQMLIDAGADDSELSVVLARATREAGRRLGYVND